MSVNKILINEMQNQRRNSEKTKDEVAKKRVSMSEGLEEPNVRNSLSHLQESIQSMQFNYPVSFKECLGWDNVIVTPTYMEFRNGVEGITMKQKLTIKNAGLKAANVRIQEPNSIAFEIKDIQRTGYRLYPGLSVTKEVLYSYKMPSSLHSMIPIEINGTMLDYDLICTFSSSRIAVEPMDLDVGHVNLESVSEIHKLMLTNIGGKSARFSVDLGKIDMGINISPMKGIVAPNCKVKLLVQITGKHEGPFNNEFWIKSKPNIRISIKGNIIKPRITVIHPTSTDECCFINFPTIFLETQRQIKIKLKNASSEVSSFVILNEMNESLTSIQNMETNKDPTFDVFKIHPLEGKLQAFEEIYLSITFFPTLKALYFLRKQNQDKDTDYFAAIIKICKIGIVEAKKILEAKVDDSNNIPITYENYRLSNIYNSLNMTEDNDDEYAKSAHEQMQLEASKIYLHGDIEMARLVFVPNELVLGDLNVADKVKRVICVTNPSRQLPLTFTFVPKPCIRCEPQKARLGPNQCVEVLVSIDVQFNLEPQFKVEFDVWADSVKDNESNKMESVNIYRLFVKCFYNLLKAAGKIRSDRYICKVGSLNNLPPEPDYNLAYTWSEMENIMNHREYYAQYFRSVFSHKKENLKEKEFSYCEDINTMSLPDMLENRNASAAQKNLNRYLELKDRERDERQLTMQLAPSQIYEIHVSPLKLDFGKVAKGTTNYRQLRFENRNNFQVMIKLISLDTQSVAFPEVDRISLQPESTITCPVEFRALHTGKFNTYINYVINNNAKCQLLLAATIVSKNLEIKTKEVIFEKDCHPQEGYRIPYKVIEIVNRFNADTRFKWTLPENSNFKIEPRVGVVPAGRRLYLSVQQELNPFNLNRIEALLHIEDGARASLKIETPLRAALNVSLLEETIDVGEVPLNIARHVRAVIYNAELFGVFYEIDEELLRGVAVSPAHGSVPPLGIVVLTICMKFDSCIEFSTSISITVQKRLTLELKLNCSVIYPKLKFTPSKIEMKRISSNSYQVREIAITNLTDCDSTVLFLFQDYPEFHVSYSSFKKEDGIHEDEIVNISPRSTVKLFLHFCPCDLASYSFYLPIVINGLLGPANFENQRLAPSQFLENQNDYYAELSAISLLSIPTKLPTIFIESTVIAPVLSFNKGCLNFEFNENIRQDELIVTNNSDNQVSFILIIETLYKASDCPFTIAWIKGIEPKVTCDYIACLLLPDEKTYFKIEYKPRNYVVFEIPITLGNIENGHIYNRLILRGSQTVQHIECDILEIFLVPIPLRILAKQQFTVKAHDFFKSTHIYAKVCYPDKCSGNFNENTLTVSFPNGTVIKSSCMNEILVEIQLKSSISVAFCTKIIFSDIEDTTSVSVTVYGTADCSLLSTHSYDKALNENFLLTKQEKYPAELTFSPQLNGHAFEKNTVGFESKGASLSSSLSESSKPELRVQSPERRQSLDSKFSNLPKKENSSTIDLSESSVCDSTKVIKSFYPFFPRNHNSENYTLHMHKVLSAAEKWLYANLLQYQFNPKLTSGITAAFSGIISSDIASNNDKKKSYPKLCSLIDILKHMTDSNEISEIASLVKEDGYESNDERISNVLNIYYKVCDFLLSKDGCIAHISAKHLLCYNDYKEMEIKNTLKNPEFKSNVDYLLQECVFESRSKQSWLDMILQSYKCLVLNQINKVNLRRHATLMSEVKNINSLEFEVHEMNVADIIERSKKQIRQSKTEAILLAWLEYYYSITFSSKVINDFEECLSDGLAFIAVTIIYCPFLKEEFFKDIYENPISKEKKMHNAVCLLSAWTKIRLGFIVTPSEIVNPNNVQMLMLSVHLFQNLPTYLIKNKYIFNCPLTKTVARQIKLSIVTSQPFNFVVQFFGNNSNVFSSKSVVSIKSLKKQNIKITYHARKISRSKAYLVLCGSAIGTNFVENQTFILEAFPDELEISGEYTVRTSLYHIVEKTVSVTIPYEYATEYEVWLFNERPNSLDNLQLSRWTDVQFQKAPRRLLFKEKSLLVGENSETAELTLIVACMSCELRTFWIALRSELADFIIQINSNYQSSITNHVTIEVMREECICSQLPQVFNECPLNEKFTIPSRNFQLQNCLLQSFKKSLTPKENLFWTNYLDNYTGLRMIKWITRDAEDSILKEFRHAFNPSVTYNITVNKKNALLMPRSITIEDNQKYDADDIELSIHMSEVNTELTKARVTFTSLDKKEIRVCKIDFVYENSSSEVSEEQSKNKKNQINNKNKPKII